MASIERNSYAARAKPRLHTFAAAYALERVIDVDGVAEGETGDCDAVPLGLGDTDDDAAGLALELADVDVESDGVGDTVGVAKAPENAMAMQQASVGLPRMLVHEASVQSPSHVVDVPVGVKTTPLPSPPVGSLPAHKAWPAADKM